MNRQKKLNMFHAAILLVVSVVLAVLISWLTLYHRYLGAALLALMLWIIFFSTYYTHGKILKIINHGLTQIRKHTESMDANLISSPDTPAETWLEEQPKLFYILRLSDLFQNFSREIEASISTIEAMNSELERISTFKAKTLEAIFNVSNHFMNSADNESFYNLILETAIDVIDSATGGSFLLLDPESNRYYYKAALGYDFDTLKNVNFLIEETFLFANANGNYDAPVIIKNVPQWDDALLSPHTKDGIEKAGGLEIVEALSSPIVIDDKIIAILNIDSKLENAFDEVDKQLIQFFSSQIAISLKNRMLVEETVSLSRFDKLTGAYNRNYFEKIFATHRVQSLEKMEPYALVLCDLNYLKIINDSFGHSAGDLVLTAFAKTIRNSIRETDVFSRIGGDEFVILLEKITFSQAEEKMASVFKQFENLTTPYLGHELPVSFSYGIAVSPDDSMVYDILVKIADMRMYNFKEQYKDKHPELLNAFGTF
jgi:diguanylate cyclase (GGDEF)-like protein